MSEAIPLAPLWHVTITVSGDPTDASRLRAGLVRLTQERPFFLLARYACDRAELRYWEEARDLDDAAASRCGYGASTAARPDCHRGTSSGSRSSTATRFSDARTEAERSPCPRYALPARSSRSESSVR